MSLSKKAVAVIGGVAGLVGLGWLISRVVAKPSVQVVVQSYPIRTILFIDNKYEVATPVTLTMKRGLHKFSAVTKSPDLRLTYGFYKWAMNGVTVSHNPTVEINITKPAIITAMFRVTQAGIYPVIPA